MLEYWSMEIFLKKTTNQPTPWRIVEHWGLREHLHLWPITSIWVWRHFQKTSLYQRILGHFALIWDLCMQQVYLAILALYNSMWADVLPETNATLAVNACSAAGCSIFNMIFSICLFLPGFSRENLRFHFFWGGVGSFWLRPKCHFLLSKRPAFTMVTR